MVVSTPGAPAPVLGALPAPRRHPVLHAADLVRETLPRCTPAAAR